MKNKYIVKFAEGVVIIINASNKQLAMAKLFNEYESLCILQDFEIMTVTQEESQMYKLTNTINQAIEQCQVSGQCSGIEILDSHDTRISASWEKWEVDENFDTITVYIEQNGIIVFRFQVEESRIKACY